MATISLILRVVRRETYRDEGTRLRSWKARADALYARPATKLLAVKTLSDAIEVNAGFTCSSLETLVGGSAKLSEIGVKLAAETSQPLFGQLARGWSKPVRPGG